ncbi:Chromatin structure-remodeling complex subunit SFH1 [Nakaseomyces bracarensis]|uniref:Chromatin structure-remodeling complex subunit SFH1 n=1 Tax=Nakaseomyces bracarensis TaxID=273131 RepID=A0ABR4NPH8_9SACH
MSHRQLAPQAAITNLYNRVKEDGVALVQTVQRTGVGSRRSRNAVNYSEMDAFEELEEGIAEREYEERENSISNISGTGNSFGSDSSVAGIDEKGTSIAENLVLPDLEDLVSNNADPSLNVLKYRKVRDTFFGGKFALKYKKTNNLTQAMSVVPRKPFLIPITLKVDNHQDGTMINDNIIWNINDTTITPEQFADVLVQDLGLGNNVALSSNISNAIKDQISKYQTIEEQLKNTESNMATYPDFHIHLNISCNLQDRHYEDNFQWNINDESLTPEKFAAIVVQDLGLTREFLPAIAAVLHDEVLRIKKEWIKGEFNQQLLHPEDTTNMVRIETTAGDLDLSWSPRVEILSQEEIQKREVERERQIRRMKRDSDRLGRRGRRR